MADSTLAEIRRKVRRLTRSVSESQLSTADLDQYVNTFVLYDIPEHLRLFSLRKTFSFVTNPGQDVYPTTKESVANQPNNPLYDFINKYITVHEPFYIAGFRSLYSESRDQFFGIYPFNNTITMNTGVTGNGVAQTFNGTIPFTGNGGGTSLLQNNVYITSIDTNRLGLAMVDVPVVDVNTGLRTQIGNLYSVGQQPIAPPTVVDPTNNVNYSNGVFTVTFPSAPDTSQAIFAEVVPMVQSRPEAVLYFNNTFTVRPVPDKPYPVNFEVYVRPTELLTSSQTPELEQWWQYIAYGAAKKVFEDRQDLESVALITPEYKQQERLVLRRTIVQQTAERVATIYTESVGDAFGFGFFNRGGNV